MSERVSHHSPEEAKDHFREAFAHAAKSGRWLGVAFWVNEDNKVQMHRTQSKFPPGDYAIALEMLKRSVQEELTEPPEPDPLPLAPELTEWAKARDNGSKLTPSEVAGRLARDEDLPAPEDL